MPPDKFIKSLGLALEPDLKTCINSLLEIISGEMADFVYVTIFNKSLIRRLYLLLSAYENGLPLTEYVMRMRYTC